MKEIGDTESRFFLRVQVEDRPGVLASLAGVLGNNGVSIAQLVQKSRRPGSAELVIITDQVPERHFSDALTIFRGMSSVQKVASLIRVYG